MDTCSVFIAPLVHLRKDCSNMEWMLVVLLNTLLVRLRNVCIQWVIVDNACHTGTWILVVFRTLLVNFVPVLGQASAGYLRSPYLRS